MASRMPSCLDRKRDRKSTRLNYSHHGISYAVFCLKKIRLPDGGEAMLVETVCSTHKLPHGFVDAAKSTLEEVQTAHLLFLFFNDRAPPNTYPLPLPDALPT